MQVISDGVLFKKGAAPQMNQNAAHRKVYFGVYGRRRKRNAMTPASGWVFAILYYFEYYVLI